MTRFKAGGRKISCEVIRGKRRCGKKAKFVVRHKDHSKEESFYVCKDCIPAYKYKIDPRARGSFVVKEITALTGPEDGGKN